MRINGYCQQGGQKRGRGYANNIYTKRFTKGPNMPILNSALEAAHASWATAPDSECLHIGLLPIQGSEGDSR